MRFLLEPYVAKEYENVNKAIAKLKVKIMEYVQDFSSNILEKNIQKFNDVSLFYYENRIKHIFP